MPKTILTLEPVTDEYYPEGVRSLTPGNEHNEASMREKWRGDVELLNRERAAMLEAFREAGVPVLLMPSPSRAYKTKHDVRESVQYVRDTMVGGQDGRVLLFNIKTQARSVETEVSRKYLEAMGLDVIESSRGFNEGGNSRMLYRADGPWMFASTSVRSSREALLEQAEFLKVPEDQRLIMNIQKGFHFDCGFMILTDESEAFHAVVHRKAFDAPSNHRLDAFARTHEIELMDATDEDAESMALNQLFTHGASFRSAPFSQDETESRWTSIPGVDIYTTPLTENRHTGGQNHCLTQEIYSPKPMDLDAVNRRLSAYPDLFEGAKARFL